MLIPNIISVVPKRNIMVSTLGEINGSDGKKRVQKIPKETTRRALI